VSAKLLVVDDEEGIRANLKRHFVRRGMEVLTAECGTSAIAICGASMMDVVLLDLRLPDVGGLEVLERVKASSPQTSVVVITAHGDVDTAVKAMQLKADHFLVKPVDLAALDALVQRLLESSRRLTELRYLKEKVSRLEGVPERARHRLPASLAATIQALAASPATSVLIQGETGTGKGVAARLIHELSARASNAFVDLNCATLSPEFLESELFGHERGAFTDAKTFKRGLLELANGGTLFLDEIGELAPPVQAKLLKVLEDRRFRRLGGTSLLKVDARILAASNADLERAVRAGRFRADLYYRLNVMSLLVPPLRQRRDEILPLAKDFLEELRGSGTAHGVLGLATEAEVALQSYAWPGNIRELRNVMERAALLASGRDLIGADLLPDAVVRSGRAAGLDAVGDLSLEALEREHIAKVLGICGHSRSQAARLLGIHRSTLLQKIARYGFVRPS
jgi:DNA-binding NtrC family response regulator